MPRLGYLLILMVGCSSVKCLAETEIDVYYAWPGHERIHRSIASRFMESNADIEVSFPAIAPDYNVAVQTLIRQSLAGQMPDVHFVGYHLLRELVNRDLVVPLDSFVASLDMEALGFSEHMLALGRINGKQYSLPFTLSMPVIYYNADLVRRAGGDPNNMPDSWEGVIQLASKIGHLGRNVDGIYLGIGTDDWMFQNLIRSFGGTMMSPNGKDVAFAGVAGEAAVSLYHRLHTAGGQPAISEKSARQQFLAGTMGMYVTSGSAVGRFARSVGNNFQLGTTVMPVTSADGRLAGGGAAGVILRTGSTKERAAWEYLLFASGPVGQDIVVRNSGYVPVNSLALGDDFLKSFYKENPMWQAGLRQLNLVVPWHSWQGDNGDEISRVLRNNMQAIANDQKTPSSALADMATEVRGLLPMNRIE